MKSIRAMLAIALLCAGLIFAAQGGAPFQNATQPSDNQSWGQVGDAEGNQAQNGSGNMGAGDSGKGIEATVREIVDARKNGSIDVPQGLVVRVAAQNRVMNFGNITQVALNETLMLKVGNRTLGFSMHGKDLNISDGDSSADTNETVEIENGTVSVGGKRIDVMPSEVRTRLNATVKSQRLAMVGGEPAYEVNATRKAKFLWMFEAEMNVQATVDARNGQVVSENRPWWSFLAGTE
jgi:hypothetical protein